MRESRDLNPMPFEKPMTRFTFRSYLTLTLFLLSLSLTFKTFARNPRPTDLSRPLASRVTNQYDDPYSEFRNAKYSNAGLLNERDEVKLGTQLHREVTKKFNLTDVGLDRVERIGQRCARVSLRPNLTYRFYVIQSREINGFSF